MTSRLEFCLRSAAARLPQLLPSCCALCAGPAPDALCRDCELQFFPPPPARCRQCALPLASGATVCGACLAEPPAFDATLVACDYAAPQDQLVQGLKFAGQLAYAALMARLLRDAMLLQPMAALPEILLPVPLGRERLALRGFNQALEMTRSLSAMLGTVHNAALLLRERETGAQSLLHPQARQRNMAGAFALAPAAREQLKDRHIGLVDDVMTTGATLNEIAATLKQHGAARVTNLVFARTPPPT